MGCWCIKSAQWKQIRLLCSPREWLLIGSDRRWGKSPPSGIQMMWYDGNWGKGRVWSAEGLPNILSAITHNEVWRGDGLQRQQWYIYNDIFTVHLTFLWSGSGTWFEFQLIWTYNACNHNKMLDQYVEMIRNLMSTLTPRQSSSVEIVLSFQTRR